MTKRTFAVIAGTLLAAIAAAQPAPKPATPAGPGADAAGPQAQPPAPAVPEPQGFTYSPEGRRDPFVSLMRRGNEMQERGMGMRPPGLAGLGTGEIQLKGTLQSRTGYVALVQGADGKTYIVKPGEKLFDGTVQTITANMMVILQQVNDPLSLEKQREVRKMLRQTDEVK